MNTRRRCCLALAATLASCMQLAYGAMPLPSASDGVWQASIATGAGGAVLHVKRLGTKPELRTNARFLPPGVALPHGEWHVTTLALANQKLTVVLRFSPRSAGGAGNSQDKLFEFDLSQREAPLVRFDIVTHRDGRHDVHEFDLQARTSAWCRSQTTPDLARCSPVAEPLMARADAADIGLETMPSVEQYAPPVISNIVYGAQKTPVPKPAR